MKTAACAIIVSFLFLSGAQAQSTNGADSSAIEHVFNNARIIAGDGSVIEQGSLLLRGDIILAVGPAASMDIPATAVRHDLTGKTIIPALVNTHAHLGWEAYGDWGSQFFTAANLKTPLTCLSCLAFLLCVRVWTRVLWYLSALESS